MKRLISKDQEKVTLKTSRTAVDWNRTQKINCCRVCDDFERLDIIFKNLLTIRVVEQIRTCTKSDCPLYTTRPYQ